MMWRASIRDRLQRVRVWMTEPQSSRDGWLVARSQHVERERCALLERMSAITVRLTEVRSTSALLPEIRRLSLDLAHYRQRSYNLSYDAVELELGGFD